MQLFGIVNLLDEPGQVFGHVNECLLTCGVDISTFRGLDEAFCLRIVIGIADSAHGTLQTGGIERPSIGLTCVLASAVRVVNAARWRLSVLERRTQHCQCQRHIQAF